MLSSVISNLLIYELYDKYTGKSIHVCVFFYKRIMISLKLKHLSNKFNIRNKFQKVQKWNCHDLHSHINLKQRRSRKTTAQQPHLLTPVGRT